MASVVADTHAALWHLRRDQRLSVTARNETGGFEQPVSRRSGNAVGMMAEWPKLDRFRREVFVKVVYQNITPCALSSPGWSRLTDANAYSVATGPSPRDNSVMICSLRRSAATPADSSASQ